MAKSRFSQSIGESLEGRSRTAEAKVPQQESADMKPIEKEIPSAEPVAEPTAEPEAAPEEKITEETAEEQKEIKASKEKEPKKKSQKEKPAAGKEASGSLTKSLESIMDENVYLRKRTKKVSQTFYMTEENRDFLRELAEENEASISDALDEILNMLRKRTGK